MPMPPGFLAVVSLTATPELGRPDDQPTPAVFDFLARLLKP